MKRCLTARMWECSKPGADMKPQKIDRLCSHYSTESSQQTEERGTGRDPWRDVYSLGCALLYPLQIPAGCGGGEGVLIPVRCAEDSDSHLPRPSLSVDLPEGLDGAKFIVKLGQTAVRPNQIHFKGFLFSFRYI